MAEQNMEFKYDENIPFGDNLRLESIVKNSELEKTLTETVKKECRKQALLGKRDIRMTLSQLGGIDMSAFIKNFCDKEKMRLVSSRAKEIGLLVELAW